MRDPRSRSAVAAIYAALILTNFVAAAGLTTLYSMLPALYREFGERGGAGWAVTAYLLVAAVSAALCGRLGDLLGRRFMVLVVLVMAAMGALVSAYTTTLSGLIFGCALQGVAGALTPLAIGLARELLDARRVPVAVGIISAAGVAGAGVAYLAAGAVIDHFASHGGFVLKVGIAALTIVTVLVVIPRPRTRPESLRGIDFVHGILFAPAIAVLLIGVEKGGQWGWSDWRTLAGLLLGAAGLAYWARHQARQAKPLIDVRVLRHRTVALANLAMICVALGCVQFGQLYALFLQQPAWTGAGFSFSGTALGYFMLSVNLLAVVVSPLSGTLANRFGARRVALSGAGISIGAWILLAVSHHTLLQALAAGALIMFAYCLLFPALYMIIVESVPAESTSEATGVTSVFLAAFMAVGAQLLYRILAASTVIDPARDPAPYPSDEAFTWTFMYAAVMCVVCVVALVAIRRQPVVQPSVSVSIP